MSINADTKPLKTDNIMNAATGIGKNPHRYHNAEKHQHHVEIYREKQLFKRYRPRYKAARAANDSRNSRYYRFELRQRHDKRVSQDKHA